MKSEDRREDRAGANAFFPILRMILMIVSVAFLVDERLDLVTLAWVLVIALKVYEE